MSDPEVHMDPIEDGQPSPSPILLGVTALALGAGIVEIYHGSYSVGIAHVVLAGFAFIADRNRRRGWDRGYRAAADSLQRSVEYIEERESDGD